MSKQVQARLTLRGIQQNKGTFPQMNKLKMDMIRQGYPEAQLRVSYAIAWGVHYCRRCGEQTRNPESDFYQGNEYWQCRCGHNNFISKTIK